MKTRDEVCLSGFLATAKALGRGGVQPSFSELATATGLNLNAVKYRARQLREAGLWPWEQRSSRVRAAERWKAETLAAAEGVAAGGIRPAGVQLAGALGLNPGQADGRIRHLRALGEWPYDDRRDLKRGRCPLKPRARAVLPWAATLLEAAEAIAAGGGGLTWPALAEALGWEPSRVKNRIATLRGRAEWPFACTGQERADAEVVDVAELAAISASHRIGLRDARADRDDPGLTGSRPAVPAARPVEPTAAEACRAMRREWRARTGRARTRPEPPAPESRNSYERKFACDGNARAIRDAARRDPAMFARRIYRNPIPLEA